MPAGLTLLQADEAITAAEGTIAGAATGVVVTAATSSETAAVATGTTLPTSDISTSSSTLLLSLLAYKMVHGKSAYVDIAECILKIFLTLYTHPLVL